MTCQAGGVWVAYHYDWSGFAIFEHELDALRHAVSNSMTVGFSPFGQELGSSRYPAAQRDDPEDAR